jgi:hypothetical protein
MTYALRGCSHALIAGSKPARSSYSQVAGGGHCWLLMAVRKLRGTSASVVRRPGSRWSGGVGSRSPGWLLCWLPVTASFIRPIATANALQGISNADIEGLVSRMLASRDRRPRGHPASGRLDRVFCGSAGTFPSWEAGRRADEPIDPERNHADPGSTSTCAGGRGAARLLPPRPPALPSPAPPCGDNECRESVTRPALRRPSSNLLIRRFQCRRPDPFRTVRDLGRVRVRCPCESGELQGRSSVWLPAWLPDGSIKAPAVPGTYPRDCLHRTGDGLRPVRAGSRLALGF